MRLEDVNSRQTDRERGLKSFHDLKCVLRFRCAGFGGLLHLHSPSTLKKTMLKTEANNVAGRKMAPSSEIVFIEVLSRLLAWASRR